MHLKIIMQSGRSQITKSKLCIILFIWNHVKYELTYSVSDCLSGKGKPERAESRYDKGAWKIFESMFIILMVGMVSWVYTYLKTYKIVHFKYSQLHVN